MYIFYTFTRVYLFASVNIYIYVCVCYTYLRARACAYVSFYTCMLRFLRVCFIVGSTFVDYCVTYLFIAFYSHIVCVCEFLCGLVLHICMDSCVDVFMYICVEPCVSDYLYCF